MGQQRWWKRPHRLSQAQLLGASLFCFGLALFIVATLSRSCTVHAQSVEPAPVAGKAQPDRLFTAARIAHVVGQGLDGGTTLVILKTIPGAREANPILGSSLPRNAAIKAGITVLIDYYLRKLHRTSPKSARVAAWIAAGVYAAVAGLNVRAVKRAGYWQ